MEDLRKNIRKRGLHLIPVIILCLLSCKKYLDKKPDDRLATITSSADMQALLDNYSRVSFADQAVTEVCSDNYFLTDATYNARTETTRNLYNWASANVFDPRTNSWSDTYNVIYIANLVIQNAIRLEKNTTEKEALNLVLGQAKFHRAREFLNAVTVWSLDYNSATASRDLGIPLLVEPDFNIQSRRATVLESYNQIIQDLKEAIPLLPLQTITPLRPSKAAGYGMMSRALLYMKDYKKARLYADSCLKLKSTLMNFNTLNPNAPFPIPRQNVEIIFESKMTAADPILQPRAFINPELYALYAASDLRRTIFFQTGSAGYNFKGNYEGDDSFFNGIAVDEMILIRAECSARLGELEAALLDLNLLRRNRILTASYIELKPGTAQETLVLIKQERRMEFPFRGLRWMDIKRWNAEGDQIILTRRNNQVIQTLLPNDLRYAIALPEDVIQLSGMEQNSR